MSRNYANIFTAIWRDPDWRALDDRSQRMYLLLATQPNISAAGMLPLTVGRWAAMAENTSPASIRDSLDRLAATRFVAVDEATEELLVRSFVRHDGGHGNPKRRPVILRAAQEIESASLRRVLAEEFSKLDLKTDSFWPGEDGGTCGEVLPEVATPAKAESAQKVNPQVDSLSDRLSDGLSASDGVVVTKEVVVRTSTLNPQPSTPAVPAQRANVVVPGWLHEGHDPGRSLLPLNPPQVGRQGGLFAKNDVKITDREQVILDWLRANDYLEATPADAKAVDKRARQAWPGKGIGYLRGVAANTGFANLYEQMRQERAKKVDEQIRRLEDTKPACEHGTPAGLELHPTHGTMLCPQCRAGIPAKPDEPTTPAPVAAALDAFRREHTGYLGTYELIGVTQQVTALHAAGATEQQLVTVAVTAARTGVGILAAAARKDS